MESKTDEWVGEWPCPEHGEDCIQVTESGKKSYEPDPKPVKKPKKGKKK